MKKTLNLLGCVIFIFLCIMALAFGAWNKHKELSSQPTTVYPAAEPVYQDVFTATRGTKIKPSTTDVSSVFIGNKKYNYLKDPSSGVEVFIPLK